MTTTIKIIETDEIIEITMSDPKTGCSWDADFIGNADGLQRCEGEDADYIATKEDADWWVDHCELYQSADDERYEAEQESSLDSDDIAKLYEENVGGLEFNDLPYGLSNLAIAIREAEPTVEMALKNLKNGAYTMIELARECVEYRNDGLPANPEIRLHHSGSLMLESGLNSMDGVASVLYDNSMDEALEYIFGVTFDSDDVAIFEPWPNAENDIFEQIKNCTK